MTIPVTVEGAAKGSNLKSLSVYVSYDYGQTWTKLDVVLVFQRRRDLIFQPVRRLRTRPSRPTGSGAEPRNGVQGRSPLPGA